MARERGAFEDYAVVLQIKLWFESHIHYWLFLSCFLKNQQPWWPNQQLGPLSYKHHDTVKYLISITPQGTVTFLSKGYGGRASDECITENCEYL